MARYGLVPFVGRFQVLFGEGFAHYHSAVGSSVVAFNSRHFPLVSAYVHDLENELALRGPKLEPRHLSTLCRLRALHTQRFWITHSLEKARLPDTFVPYDQKLVALVVPCQVLRITLRVFLHISHF